MINTNTKLVGLLGDPVAHSLSPLMHNAAFHALGLNYRYLAFRVSAPSLSKAIEGIKGLGLRGVNITIPHKKAVLPMLDEVDTQAKRIGAVNTIINEDGKLKGYNTDATGFLAALGNYGFEPKGQKTVVLGAGGVARAVAFALNQAGASISIINRSLSTAEVMAREIGATAFESTQDGYRAALAGASLLVNATSLGMTPDDPSPLPSGMLGAGITVFDTVYHPRQTRLLKEAEAAGCAVIGGLEMLIEQGALAFELWTGQNAPRQVMRQVVNEALL